MRFQVYAIPYHFPTTAENEEEMLYRAIKKILNNEIISTKFMVIYAQKYKDDEDYTAGVVYCDYDIDTDTLIFDSDYNEGQDVVFQVLWALPQSITDCDGDRGVIKYHSIRECSSMGWFE